MRILVLGLTAGLAFAPIAALAADTTGTDSTQPTPAVAMAEEPNPVVCHYFYYEGMVINRQVCKPKHEWDRRRFAEQRFIREFQQRALTHD